jgi:hypothetical protein
MSDVDRWKSVFVLGAVGMVGVGIFGAAGGAMGWRSAARMCAIARASTQIHQQEQSLLRRYTFSPEFKKEARFALFNILAGPSVMLGRHVLNNLALKDKGGATFEESIFIDFLMFPIGCSALSYSLMFKVGLLWRTKFGVALEAFKRVF